MPQPNPKLPIVSHDHRIWYLSFRCWRYSQSGQGRWRVCWIDAAWLDERFIFKKLVDSKLRSRATETVDALEGLVALTKSTLASSQKWRIRNFGSDSWWTQATQRITGSSKWMRGSMIGVFINHTRYYSILWITLVLILSSTCTRNSSSGRRLRFGLSAWRERRNRHTNKQPAWCPSVMFVCFA
jgi:hypothetical protein